MSHPLTRREFLRASAAALGSIAVSRSLLAQPATTQFSNQRYKIAACDWMMLKRQKLGAFKLAKDCGMDGLEVDMGPLSKDPTFRNELAKPDVREKFLAESRKLGIEICSIAMSAFYGQSFPAREIEMPVQDCIDTMKAMNVKIAFLPLGVQGDLAAHPDLRPTIVEKLKKIAPRAEDAGVIIGIETALDAEGDKKLLEEIGSPAIKVYFNFSNAIQNNRDLIAELKPLGRDNICQIHCTDQDGALLQDDKKIDMPKVKQTLDEMGWAGWLVIERSRQEGRSRDVKYNFGANAKYLKSVFQG